MSTLLCNVPPIKVWVHKHALRDYTDQYDEWTLGYWVTAKSIPGRALYFETYLTEYGACYDKLTIDAFRSFDPDHPDKPVAADEIMPIEDLQFWNGFDYGITVIEKNLLSNMEMEVRPRNGKSYKGKYLFTLDNYHAHRNEPDLYFSEMPDEHKSHNIVELENGYIGAYPNNRCRMTDPSLSYAKLKTPDFKVATRYVDVEYAPNWGRLGEQSEYFWETPEEKDAFDHVESVQTNKEAQENPWDDSLGPTM